MIPKITTGSSVYGVIQYNDKEKATLISLENMSSEYLLTQDTAKKRDIITAFDEWNYRNTGIKQNVFHASLNFPYQDNDLLDDAKLESIGKEFIAQMGYNNVPFVIYKHSDKNHTHIHIVASRVGENGKKIDDKNEVYRAIEVARNLEIKHGLFRVQPKQEAKLKNTNDLNMMSFKNKMLFLIDQALHKECVKDLAEFRQYLLNNGIQMSSKEFDTKPYRGFSFFDVKQNSQIYGKNLHKSLAKKLESKFQVNTKRYSHKMYRRAIDSMVKDLMDHQYSFQTQEQFEKYCHQYQLQPIYDKELHCIRFNYMNNVTGITYHSNDLDLALLPTSLKDYHLIPKLDYIQSTLLQKIAYEEKKHIGQIQRNVENLIQEKALYQHFSFSDIVKELNARGIKLKFSYQRNKYGNLEVQKLSLYHNYEADAAKQILPEKSNARVINIDNLSKLLAIEENKIGKSQMKELLKQLHETGGLIHPSTADILLLNKIETQKLGTRPEDKANAYLKRHLLPSLLVKDRVEATKSKQPSAKINTSINNGDHYQVKHEDDKWLLK